MTTNKPEVVAYLHTNKEIPEHRGVSLCLDPNCPSILFNTEFLIRLTDYEAMQAKCMRLVEALEQIERWDGFPSTNETWEGSGKPVSYSAAFGSNGERDFMRGVAKAALAACREQKGDL